MVVALPESPRRLRWLLARKLGFAAIAIGAAAGGVSYLLETHRAEQAALDRAVASARHFESPAMQMALDARILGEHDALSRLLDRNRFVGIRVFTPESALIYEAWEDIPTLLIDSARAHLHESDWTEKIQGHRNWIEVSGERLIQVVLPLIDKNGTLVGYLEGVSRLDQETIQMHQEQARYGALTAVTSVIIAALLLYPLLLAMLKRSTDLSRRLLDSNLSLIQSLGNAIAKRDSDTDIHNYRVTYYTVALAEAMSLPLNVISNLVAGAFLHDIGKIGIPDRILLKPGKLAPDEFEVMKAHVLLGVEIVADNPWLESAASTIRHHHERFDGTGYPDGLRGEAIPLAARIFAVVDVFDALTSKRPYKEPMSLDYALAIIKRDAGRHFDPKVVAVFKEIAPVLHGEMIAANDFELRQKMREVLQRYFRTEAAPEGAASITG